MSIHSNPYQVSFLRVFIMILFFTEYIDITHNTKCDDFMRKDEFQFCLWV